MGQTAKLFHFSSMLVFFNLIYLSQHFNSRLWKRVSISLHKINTGKNKTQCFLGIQHCLTESHCPDFVLPGGSAGIMCSCGVQRLALNDLLIKAGPPLKGLIM